MLVVRNNHPIARILPGVAQMTALEAMSDPYRTLPLLVGGRIAACKLKMMQGI